MDLKIKHKPEIANFIITKCDTRMPVLKGTSWLGCYVCICKWQWTDMKLKPIPDLCIVLSAMIRSSIIPLHTHPSLGTMVLSSHLLTLGRLSHCTFIAGWWFYLPIACSLLTLGRWFCLPIAPSLLTLLSHYAHFGTMIRSSHCTFIAHFGTMVLSSHCMFIAHFGMMVLLSHCTFIAHFGTLGLGMMVLSSHCTPIAHFGMVVLYGAPFVSKVFSLQQFIYAML